MQRDVSACHGSGRKSSLRGSTQLLREYGLITLVIGLLAACPYKSFETVFQGAKHPSDGRGHGPAFSNT